MDNLGVKTGNLWDIFCKIIDNYGDIGVCWRLSVGLAERGERVRLWVDDASPLRWMAPEGAEGVEVRPWAESQHPGELPMGDMLVEAFGCDIAPEFIAAYKNSIITRGLKARWINLEYLSAETFAERCHGLPSPVMSGPGAGLTKHFFYPGFTAATGGLLREPELAARQAHFDRQVWLRQLGIEFQNERLISLFCYEPPALCELLKALAADTQATRLLVTAGRAAAAVQACLDQNDQLPPAWNDQKMLSISYLPRLTQLDFDHLLWACDLNFVRGEDSLVRALWGNKPFIWQIYPQHDDAHHHKLDAFLNLLDAPQSLRVFHHAWNNLMRLNQSEPTVLPPIDTDSWLQIVTQARKQQLQHEDLVTQLIQFALKSR